MNEATEHLGRAALYKYAESHRSEEHCCRGGQTMDGRSRRCQEPEGNSQELTEAESLELAACCGSSNRWDQNVQIYLFICSKAKDYFSFFQKPSFLNQV